MKRNNYTLIGAFKKASGTDVMKEYMDDYFSFSSNQEKFALAWINGYKVEEKNFLLSLHVFLVVIITLTMIRKKRFLT